MGEASRDEYKIQSFDAATQQLLKTALKGEHTGPSLWARAAEGLRPRGRAMPKPSRGLLRVSHNLILEPVILENESQSHLRS